MRIISSLTFGRLLSSCLLLWSTGSVAEPYLGLGLGQGWAVNSVIDRDGFSNEGYPGYRVNYRDNGVSYSALAGYRVQANGWYLALEVDATHSDIQATSMQIDPVGLDEEISTRNKLLGAFQVRLGLSRGAWKPNFSAGYAYSRFENELYDLDFGSVYDPDDSYFEDGTDEGWTAGLGLDYALTERWHVRLDGRYFDFGSRAHYVNRQTSIGRSGVFTGIRKYDSKNRFVQVRLSATYLIR